MATFLDRHMVVGCAVVNRVEATDPDVHGNPVYLDADPIQTYCFASPRAGAETPDGRAVEQGWTIYLPASMAGQVSAFSYLDVDGLGRMEVDGDPAEYTSLAGHRAHHIEVTARRSTA